MGCLIEVIGFSSNFYSYQKYGIEWSSNKKIMLRRLFEIIIEYEYWTLWKGYGQLTTLINIFKRFIHLFYGEPSYEDAKEEYKANCGEKPKIKS